MAEPTPVNPQITDSVSPQSSSSKVDEAQSISLAMVYQNLAHASILAMQNAVQQQQSNWTVQMAVTARLVSQILSDGPGLGMGDPLYDLFDGEDDFDDPDDEGGPF